MDNFVRYKIINYEMKHDKCKLRGHVRGQLKPYSEPFWIHKVPYLKHNVV